MKELQLENESLKKKIKELKNKNKLLNETVLFYANPLSDYDKGKIARDTIEKLSRGYKPVFGELAVKFRTTEVYPFVEFGNYIDDREGDTNEES